MKCLFDSLDELFWAFFGFRLGCNDMRGWWRYLNNQGLETLALENFSQEALSDLKDFLANDFRLKTSLNTITIKVNDEIVILEEFKKDLEKQNINVTPLQSFATKS